jgi:hypothetical protein
MSDWIGLAFFILLIIAIFIGLKLLAKPQKRTEEEFERRAAEGAGLAGAGMQALNKLLNPEAAKGQEVVMDLKGGRYNKKKREGKAGGKDLSEEEND